MNTMTAIPTTATNFTHTNATPMGGDSYLPSTTTTLSIATAPVNSIATATLDTNTTNFIPNNADTNKGLQLSNTNSNIVTNQNITSTNNNTAAATSNATEEKPRKRMRATPEQLAVLERTFAINSSSNHRIREQLSHELGMSERSIQIWFQNRRAKVKNAIKRSTMLEDETLRIQHYASQAAIAACQAAIFHEQQRNNSAGTPVSIVPVGNPLKTHPDLYYYYYYYYFNQQQQQQQQQQHKHRVSRNNHYCSYAYHPYAQHYQKHANNNQRQISTYPDNIHMPIQSSSPLVTCTPLPSAISLNSIPPPPPPPPTSLDEEPESFSPSNTCKTTHHEGFFWPPTAQIAPTQRARAHTVGPYLFGSNSPQKLLYDRGSSVDPSMITFGQQQQAPPTMYNLKINTAASEEATTTTRALYTPVEQQPEAFPNLLLTQELSSTSPTSPSSIAMAQQQQQFANLSMHDNGIKVLDNFLNSFEQQQAHTHPTQQSMTCWSDISFYNDDPVNIMMSPITPPFATTTTEYTNNMLAMTMSAFTYPSDTAAIEKECSTFSAETLQIGTWKRMAFQPGDLLCQYIKGMKGFSWCIQDGPCRFRLEFPETVVQSISLQPLSHRVGWAQLKLVLSSVNAISFYMENKAATSSETPLEEDDGSTRILQAAGGTNGVTSAAKWVQCRDYTEGKQASSVNVHLLDGPALALKSELALLTKESDYIASILSQ